MAGQGGLQAPRTAVEGRCTIFRVLEGLFGGFAEACRPRAVSIGPYHNVDPQFHVLQWHKWRLFYSMLERIEPYGVRLENLINVVAPQENRIRQCYSHSTDNFSATELVEMLTVDGCFIVEILRQIAKCTRVDRMLVGNKLMMVSLVRNFVRLENQIPYFVLNDLFEATNVPKIKCLNYLVHNFFNELMDLPKGESDLLPLDGLHLLDAFHKFFVSREPHVKYPVDDKSFYASIRSASELRRVGIGFKPRAAKTFMGITFNRGRRTLEIPYISIDDPFNSILPNMVAFEQSFGKVAGHVTVYATFIGCLIRTAEDVQILRDCRIISDRSFSNEDIASFFRDIGKDIMVNIQGSHLGTHFAMVNRCLRYERIYLCWAQLVNTLRVNSWSALSALAIIVTVLGGLRTMYTLLLYYYSQN